MQNQMQVAKKASLLLVILCIFLPLVESLIRKTGKVQTFSDLMNIKGSPYIAHYSSYLPFTLQPNLQFLHETSEFSITYNLNNYGYRGLEPKKIEKNTTEKRILFLGDSFTFGWGNELQNTFVQKIQNLLKKNPETKHWNAINCGYYGGYSPDSYYAYLRSEGLALKPSVAIFVIYSNNDILDIGANIWKETDCLGAPINIQSTRLYTDYKGELIDPPDVLKPYMRWYYRVPFLQNNYTFLAATKATSKIIEPDWKKRGPFVWKELEYDKSWSRFCTCIKSLIRLAQLNDIAPYFVLLDPNPTRPDYIKDPGAGERIAKFLKQNIPKNFIDLRPYLKGDSYLPIDGHFNEKGNAITANLILNKLNADQVLIRDKHNSFQ